ncbi:hypothetical protein Nizo2264_0922 [Lactiplantibacillus plantarum]|nr:hypothetical protein Nizo2264_0922 [Lactiplantibacillus plantarum]
MSPIYQALLSVIVAYHKPALNSATRSRAILPENGNLVLTKQQKAVPLMSNGTVNRAHTLILIIQP